MFDEGKEGESPLTYSINFSKNYSGQYFAEGPIVEKKEKKKRVVRALFELLSEIYRLFSVTILFWSNSHLL